MDTPDPDRLDEMEERLRGLQARLEADLGVRAAEPSSSSAPPPRPPRVAPPSPSPSPSPSPPPPPSSGSPTALAGHLVRAMRELLDGYEVALAHADTRQARLDVSAGPFADTAALERFSHAVSELPGVVSAEVRGYEGTNRAIVEIELTDRPLV